MLHISDTSCIYEQFKGETVRLLEEESNLLELIKAYSSICDENSSILKSKLLSLNINRQKELYNSIQIENEELKNEKHLWNLIYKLFEDNHLSRQSNQDNDGRGLLKGNYSESLNEAAIVADIEKNNPLLRRIKIVLKWLEEVARESNSLKQIREKMSSFSEKCSGWEHTLHHLKNTNMYARKDRGPFTGRDYINELDPDAPIRTQKPLHDLDQEDEYKITEYMFAFIRAGDLNSARDFCAKVGQPWRGATLEGFKYYMDENYEKNTDKLVEGQQHELLINEGNVNRDIWRFVVYRLIKDEHFSPYDKAIYGSLAGFISPVIPLCRNYTDFIWIFFKALYYHIIESEIRHKITVRDFVKIPYDPDEENLLCSSSINSSTGSKMSSANMSQIFDKIRVLISNASSTSAVNLGESKGNSSSTMFGNQVASALKADIQRPFSVVLKHVIIAGLSGFENDVNELMDYLRTVCSTETNNGILLRLASHLTLFFRSASIPISEENFVQINDLYVQYLINNGYKETIAFYLSQLTQDIQISRYAKFLQSITDSKERIMLLKIAKDRNMNVQAITLNIVENLNQGKSSSDLTTSRNESFSLQNNTSRLSNSLALTTTIQAQPQQLNEEDLSKINAIDWIVYDTTQRLKLLEYANLSMRYFLLKRQNFDACRVVFGKIPGDTISTILSEYNYGAHPGQSSSDLQNFIENMPKDVGNTIKEYLCCKEYIEAMVLYNDWFEFFHKDKPIKPARREYSETKASEPSFADKMAQDFEQKQFEDLSARWFNKALLMCDKVKIKFNSVLKFPMGGWMKDLPSGDESNDESMNSSDNSEDSIITDGSDSPIVDKRTRQHELECLRRLYLPSISFIFIDMLGKMNLNHDLIRVCNLIAAEDYKLYALFESQQLKSFLHRVADASINLLDSGKDFLGFTSH